MRAEQYPDQCWERFPIGRDLRPLQPQGLVGAEVVLHLSVGAKKLYLGG
jgi:hypothetical protein